MPEVQGKCRDNYSRWNNRGLQVINTSITCLLYTSDPYHSYIDMFNGECVLASSNREILFSRQSTGINGMNKYAAPGVLNAWNVFFVPQSLVDAYYMADGRTINNASEAYPYEEGYTNTDLVFSGEKNSNGFTLLSGTHKWYANREMRFYATIAFNNSYFPSTSTPPDLSLIHI